MYLYLSPIRTLSYPACGDYLQNFRSDNRLSDKQHRNDAMTNPCYTCRRRHIQCDCSGVPCAKCQKAGLQCFDKRPLRWVKGVAARGNLQGVSAEDAASRTQAVARAEAARPPAGLGDNMTAGLDRVSRFYLDYCELASLSPHPPRRPD